MTNKTDNLKNKIIDDLHKTGFLKELEIAKILRKNQWSTSLNQTYLDKDFNTNREIDIIAHKKGNIEFDRLHIWVNLIIECKKTKNPWLIISNEEESGLRYKIRPGWTIIHAGEKYVKSGAIFPPSLIDENFMRSDFRRIGSAFHDSFKEPRETSKIFQSIITACKASMSKAEIYDSSKKWEDYEEKDPTYIEFYHPIVVVDGPLYEAYLNTQNELTVDKVEWIPISYDYSSNEYSKAGRSKTLHCDIVSFNYFEKYLVKADRWLDQLNKNCVNYYKKHYT